MSKKKAKSKPFPGLVRKPIEPGGSWESGKISGMILDFARPLLEADGGPPDMQALRNLIMLANICWNVPVLEERKDPELARHLHLLEQVPDPVYSMLKRLMHDRRTRFGAIPFLVVATVKGTSLDNVVLQAEARMPPGMTKRSL